MENNKENQELMQGKEIPCCYSEVNEKGQHITNCKNLPTELDKYNIQIRYFCKEHMAKVEAIRRKMAERYIKEYEEKIIKYLNELDNNGYWVNHIIDKVKNGGFR